MAHEGSGNATPVAVLPRGRHKLSRDDVRDSQRGRIVEAMLETVARRGYAATTVADVVASARVSRNAFYDLFADKEACFIEVCDERARIMLSSLYAEGERPTWREALARGMDAYLRAWQEYPAFAQAYLTELPAAGQRAVEQRDRAYARFRAMFEALAARARVEEPALPPLSPLATRLLVVAITEIVAEEARAGRIESLDRLHGELVEFATLLIAGP